MSAYLTEGACDTIVLGEPVVIGPRLLIGTFLIGERRQDEVACDRTDGGIMIVVGPPLVGQVRVGEQTPVSDEDRVIAMTSPACEVH